MRYFISYSSRGADDRRLALLLNTALTAAGHDVFLDVTMTVGTEWSAEIDRQLDRCEIFVVLLSKHSITSDMVRGEVQAAYGRRREGGVPRMLPIRVRLREQRLGYELDAILGRVQWLFWDGEEDTGSLLAQVLASATGVSIAPPSPAPAPPPAARERETETLEKAAAAPPPAPAPVATQVWNVTASGSGDVIGSMRDKISGDVIGSMGDKISGERGRR